MHWDMSTASALFTYKWYYSLSSAYLFDKFMYWILTFLASSHYYSVFFITSFSTFSSSYKKTLSPNMISLLCTCGGRLSLSPEQSSRSHSNRVLGGDWGLSLGRKQSADRSNYSWCQRMSSRSLTGCRCFQMREVASIKAQRVVVRIGTSTTPRDLADLGDTWSGAAIDDIAVCVEVMMRLHRRMRQRCHLGRSHHTTASSGEFHLGQLSWALQNQSNHI
jgi:hypothetical protein